MRRPLFLLLTVLLLLVVVLPAPAQTDGPPPISTDNAPALAVQWRAGLGQIEALATGEDGALFATTAGQTYVFDASDLNAAPRSIPHPGQRGLDVLPLPDGARVVLGFFTVNPSPAYYIGIADIATGAKLALFRLPDAPSGLDLDLHTDAAGAWLVANRIGHDTTLIDLNTLSILSTGGAGDAVLLPDGRLMTAGETELAVAQLPALLVDDVIELGAGLDIERIFVSPDGDTLGVLTTNLLTIILDEDLQPIRFLETPNSRSPITFTRFGDYVVQATGAGLAVLDVDTGAATTIDVLTREEINIIRDVAATTRRDQVAVAVDDRLRIVDVTTGDILAERTDFTQYTGPVFSPDSRLLFAGTRDSQLLAFDVRTGAIVQRLELDAIPAALAISDEYIAFAEGTRIYWYQGLDDAAPGSVELPELREASQALYGLSTVAVSRLAFNHDGSQLAVGAVDGRVWVIDLARFEVRLVYEHEPLVVLSLAWLADGSLLSVGGDNNIVRSAIRATEIQTFDVNERGEFELLAYNRANEFGLINDTFAADGAVYAFDFTEQRVLANTTLPRGNAARQAIRGAFSRTGSLLVIADNWQLRVLDASSLDTLMTELNTATADVQVDNSGRPIFSPDGRYIAYIQDDGTLLMLSVGAAVFGR